MSHGGTGGTRYGRERPPAPLDIVAGGLMLSHTGGCRIVPQQEMTLPQVSASINWAFDKADRPSSFISTAIASSSFFVRPFRSSLVGG